MDIFSNLCAEQTRNTQLRTQNAELKAEIHQLRIKLIMAEGMCELREIIIKSYEQAWLAKFTAPKTEGTSGS